MPNPQPLGLKKSFGFGDRLGVATPGHLAALRKTDFAPIFAQQSIREMERTQRTPEQVMEAAKSALAGQFDGVWGADADHLKTPEDVRRTAAAGFCFFTIDPSAYVENRADVMDETQLQAAVAQLVTDGVLQSGWMEPYLAQRYDLGSFGVSFTHETLSRAAVKYARAIAHCAFMAGEIEAACSAAPYEIEISVDETDSPTSVAEHLFFAHQLQQRKVKVVSLAPRFIGDFEKGIDYRGDIAKFEETLAQHVAIAQQYGPYKISIHSGSDKFTVYPIIGRLCGDLLHVKTAGTSYLEALRAVLRAEPALFAEVASYSHDRFGEDRQSYHISTTQTEVDALRGTAPEARERVYLDERAGRQLLHVTFGSVLTRGSRADGTPFAQAIMGTLEQHAQLHSQLLEAHFDRHLQLLNAG